MSYQWEIPLEDHIFEGYFGLQFEYKSTLFWKQTI
jgi:hypothetical protein